MNVAVLKVPERLPAGAAFTDRLAGGRLAAGDFLQCTVSRLLAVFYWLGF